MITFRVTICFASMCVVVASQGFKLPASCHLPFESIETVDLDIDASCSIDGNSGDDELKKLESEAKNNFCLTTTPLSITYTTFTRLQKASDGIDNLRENLKTDRGSLADLLPVAGGTAVGEGTLVRFVAFILDAHNSNIGKKTPPKKSGELVNCNNPDKESNDIHIELVRTAAEDDDCNSVTAEMSPHFRPESWSGLVDVQIKRPVRVTGSLFYDGVSHKPCSGGKRPSPHRISVWEIHPVYALDVCKSASIAACKVGDNSGWIPLDQWHTHVDSDEPEQQ
jgi:hypothetical protein